MKCQTTSLYIPFPRSVNNATIVAMFFLWSSLPSRIVQASSSTSKNGDGCEIYIAQSTIPNAGLGIFTAVEKQVGDTIGNGDVCFPLIEMDWHNDAYQIVDDDDSIEGYYMEDFDIVYQTPFDDFAWDGDSMGMGNEADGEISAIWPGLDCAINSLIPLENVKKSFPTHLAHDDYDELQDYMPDRYSSPNAGSITPYRSSKIPTVVSRKIPAGGELFKFYGDSWFQSRGFPGLPLSGDFPAVQSLLQKHEILLLGIRRGKNDINNDQTVLPIYDLLLDIQSIWKETSRTLNALPKTKEEFDIAKANDMDVSHMYQPNATRSIEWLQENGRCIDHIVHKKSTIDGAGEGAFAKHNLGKGTIITSSPLIHIPDSKLFDMYKFDVVGDSESDGRQPFWTKQDGGKPRGKQVIYNYCYGHKDSSLLFFPYGSGINYINHASESSSSAQKPNLRLEWSNDGSIHHDSSWLDTTPEEMQYLQKQGVKLSIDYVATRDIDAGEELFIDYGDKWDQAWKHHVEEWNRPKEVLTAADWNNPKLRDVPILTMDEWQDGVYPNNIQIRCHVDLIFNTDDDMSDWSKVGRDNDDGDIWPRYHSNTYEYSMIYGLPCDILEYNDKDNTYTVNMTTDHLVYMHAEQPQKSRHKKNPSSDNPNFGDNIHAETINQDSLFAEEENINDLARTLTNVPRDAIFFLDGPYESDLYIENAFRQPIGLPDRMMPDAWKNKEQKSAKANSARGLNDGEL